MITNITPRESAIAAIASDYQHEALAWSITADNLEQSTITRLQGEAHVLRYLLTKALEVLETIEADCAAEYEELDALKDQIEAALKGELKS